MHVNDDCIILFFIEIIFSLEVNFFFLRKLFFMSTNWNNNNNQNSSCNLSPTQENWFNINNKNNYVWFSARSLII